MGLAGEVLLVEDDLDVAEAVSSLLGAAGYDVTVARTIASARRDALRAGPAYDVLLVDKNLPDGSGLTFLRERAGRTADSEVVIVTGDPSVDSVLQALRQGAYDYLVKPFSDPHDVTATVRRAAERRQLRRERDEARAQAVAAERRATLVHVAAGLAHEVKNPLQGIGFACINLREILVASSLEPAVRDEVLEQLGLVEAESTRLRELVEGVMDLARPGPRPPRNVGVSELLQRVAALHASRAEKSAVSLRIDADRALLLCVDDADLTRALDNLLRNALDVAPEQSEVRLEARVHDDGRVRVEVSDRGPGFSAEARARAFRPFFTTKARGFGLGLCTVAAAAERAGGEVQIEDNAPSGARVVLYLPPGGAPGGR